MGHLNIVNNETIYKIFETGYISTRGNLNTLSIKSISDLFSDVLAIRPGDLIFPWIVKKKGIKSNILGFKYYLRISGSPIYVYKDEFPIKIPIEKKIYCFNKCLNEEEAFDLFSPNLLWNAIGKKSLGRGHSITHQTEFEDYLLLEKLKNINSEDPITENVKIQKFENSIPITINLIQNNGNDEFTEKLMKLPEYLRISHLELSKIPWIKDEKFSYEKTLEAWLVENIDKKCCLPLWELLLIQKPKILWIGNYLSYGVTGKNIDLVIIVNIGRINKIFVFELKNESLSSKKYEKVALQVIAYSNFIKKAFSLSEPNIEIEVIPIILSLKSKRNVKTSSKLKLNKEIHWFEYLILNGKVNFYDKFANCNYDIW